MEKLLLGYDIGGTKCAVILGTDEPRIIARREFPTATARQPEQALRKLADLGRELLMEHDISLERIPAVGISCGGPLDSIRGLILSPPNLPGWDDVPVTAMVEKELGIPTYIQNDANAGALAEWQWGAGKGSRNVVFLTFGTGMGAGFILDNRLYAGTNGLAGEVGHMRLSTYGPVGFGKAGSFEGWASGGGIARLGADTVKAKLKDGVAVPFCPSADQADRLTTKDIAKAARDGDAVAREILETSAGYLGRGLAVLVDLINPQVIVIGSIFLRCEDLLRSAMEKALAAEAIPAALEQCRVVPVGLGEEIGDYAALAVALYGMKSRDSNVPNEGVGNEL